MNAATPFKWRHFEAEIILLCVRWYLRYALSYRDLEEKYLVSYLFIYERKTNDFPEQGL
jgi:transposase-like protein